MNLCGGIIKKNETQMNTEDKLKIFEGSGYYEDSRGDYVITLDAALEIIEEQVKLQSLNNTNVIDGIIESRQPNVKIEATEVTRQFKADLKSLLTKYKAEITLEEQHPGISYERGLDDIVIDTSAVYDNDHNCLVEATEINLGRNVDVDSL